MPRLFVLDALGLAYRAYYAFIRRPLVNSRGENTSAIFGFATTALKLRREESPDYWALAWDGPGPTFRHERFPDYKATRKPMPDDLFAQLPAIEDLAQAIGLPVIEVPGMEADDVMGTLSRRGRDAGFDVALVTSDKDMLQLVDERVRLLSPVARGDEYQWIDAAAVMEKWGVRPDQIRDVLALMGDASDNVPGVPGVGEKTAVELIGRFGDLDALYARLDEVARPALRDKLAASRELALLSRELVTVRTDCELPYDWDALRCAPMRREALRELAARWEIKRLDAIADAQGVADDRAGARAPGRDPARRGTASETAAAGVRLAGAAAPPAPSDTRPLARAAEPAMPASWPGAGGVVVENAAEQGRLDLWTSATAAGGTPSATAAEWAQRLLDVCARATGGLALLPFGGPDPRVAPLVGLAIATRDGATAYVPIAHRDDPNVDSATLRTSLAPLLADPAVPKLGHDLKDLLHRCATAGLAFEGLAFDARLASFLLDPERDHGLEALARDALGIALPPLEPKAVRGRPRAELAALPAADAAIAASAAAATLFPLADALRTQLEAREQWGLYADLEHPLVPVLFEMERAGVALDGQVLAERSRRAAEELERLEAELQSLAGEPVNLHSGPQLAKVLFQTLGLEPGRRTRTGYSTDQATLEELAPHHAFPRLLLEYRALSKLKSTYLDALPQVVDPRDGRVHTTFNQAGAATGRLSSANPNLQNIPMRTAQGREIRRAFVAPPGATLIGADYSQIELRIMAHLSGDPALIEAFATGEDVHLATARRIFGVAADAVDPGMRARAKTVNFGVMYGMGARALAQQMGTGTAEAEEFIRNYFRVYARVRDYLDATVEEARRRGFVQTLLGRRRYLPGLASGHGGERATAERIAINAPIQGSAADLVKRAMVRVHAALKAHHPSARLLLQVHDELLLECSHSEADAVAERVRAEMIGAHPLRVPLEVSVGRGPTWLDVH